MRPGHIIDNIYFPSDCALSIVADYSDGRCIDLAMIGRDGTTGFISYLGGLTVLSRVAVRVGGTALVIPVRNFIELTQGLPALANEMRFSTLSYFHQIHTTAACNGLHNVEQRLARYLLCLGQCTDSREFPLTQDTLAEALGVHRPTISTAMKSLQNSGLIDSHRGHIQICDLDRLHQSACECYELMQAATRRLRASD